MELVLQLLLNGLASGASIALLALGFVLVLRTTGVFHIAHCATLVLSAYCIYLLSGPLGWSLWVAIPAAALVAGVFGMGMETLVYRPLRVRRVANVGMFMASLSIFIVVQNAMLLAFGGQFRALESTMGAESWTVAGLSITPVSVAAIVAAPLLYGGLAVMLRTTPLGRWIRAVSVNSTRAATIGINLNLTYMAVFGIASALAVPSAAFAALELGIHPALGFQSLLLSITAAIIGGLRNLNGALIGGFFVGIVQSLAVLWFSATWQQSIVFGILVLVLLIRPQGLLQERI